MKPFWENKYFHGIALLGSIASIVGYINSNSGIEESKTVKAPITQIEKEKITAEEPKTVEIPTTQIEDDKIAIEEPPSKKMQTSLSYDSKFELVLKECIRDSEEVTCDFVFYNMDVIQRVNFSLYSRTNLISFFMVKDKRYIGNKLKILNKEISLSRDSYILFEPDTRVPIPVRLTFRNIPVGIQKMDRLRVASGNHNFEFYDTVIAE